MKAATSIADMATETRKDSLQFPQTIVLPVYISVNFDPSADKNNHTCKPCSIFMFSLCNYLVIGQEYGYLVSYMYSTF
jgi:hypothetical protein